jgi:hypothetical protein
MSHHEPATPTAFPKKARKLKFRRSILGQPNAPYWASMAFEHDSVGFLTKKSKMAEILGWVENIFFCLKKSKIEIFQNTLPRL